MSLPSYYSIYDSFVLDTTGNIGVGTAYPKSVIDITNRKDAIVIPSRDLENTPDPVIESPSQPSTKVGVLRMNKAYGRFEQKLGTNWTQTSSWQPVIVSANPTKLQNIGMQTTVTGRFFEKNSVWSFVGTDGTNYPCISQFVNQSQVILTRPNVFPVSKSPYRIRVYNGEAAKEYISSTLLIDAGVGPTFTTPAGSLSILLPNTTYSSSMAISATDELYGGISNISIDNALTGSGLIATFSNNSLTFSGTTSQTPIGGVTYNFIAAAFDLGGNVTHRAFSFSVGFPLVATDLSTTCAITASTHLLLISGALGVNTTENLTYFDNRNSLFGGSAADQRFPNLILQAKRGDTISLTFITKMSGNYGIRCRLIIDSINESSVYKIGANQTHTFTYTIPAAMSLGSHIICINGANDDYKNICSSPSSYGNRLLYSLQVVG